MNVKESIAEWIKKARATAGLSGAGLGRELELALGDARGNTRANISHWETGKHEPSLHQIVAIVRITGVGLPNEVLSALTGRQAVALAQPHLSQPIPTLMRATITPSLDGTEQEQVPVRAATTARLDRLERLNKYESDLVTASRECQPSDQAFLLETAKNLIPDKATVHQLFPGN